MPDKFILIVSVLRNIYLFYHVLNVKHFREQAQFVLYNIHYGSWLLQIKKIYLKFIFVILQ